MTIVTDDFTGFLPDQLRTLRDPQTDLPRIAKDPKLTSLIAAAVREVPTHHDLRLGDARSFKASTRWFLVAG